MRRFGRGCGMGWSGVLARRGGFWFSRMLRVFGTKENERMGWELRCSLGGGGYLCVMVTGTSMLCSGFPTLLPS